MIFYLGFSVASTYMLYNAFIIYINMIDLSWFKLGDPGSRPGRYFLLREEKYSGLPARLTDRA